jgi:hypothetical protein
MLRTILGFLVVGLHSAVLAQSDNTCNSFNRTVKSTYDFKPSKLTKAEQDSKSAAMDRFWQMVKADPDRLLPCLRSALQEAGADSWFRFDASSLLVEIDPSQASKAIQVRCYTEVDLDDVDLQTWVRVLSVRGYEGFDVSEAAARWLTYPQARYFLPEHGAHEVTAFQGALFIFGSMDESQATPALVKLVSQRDHPGREHALGILMSQATAESLSALKRVDAGAFSERTQRNLRALLSRPDLIEPRSAPRISRQEFVQAFEKLLDGDSRSFLDLVSRVPDGEKDVVAVLKPEDIPLVRKVRRRIILGGNQHAFAYYQDFTNILMTLVWKPELVR